MACNREVKKFRTSWKCFIQMFVCMIYNYESCSSENLLVMQICNRPNNKRPQKPARLLPSQKLQCLIKISFLQITRKN